jgi:hypothetical protein
MREWHAQRGGYLFMLGFSALYDAIHGWMEKTSRKTTTTSFTICNTCKLTTYIKATYENFDWINFTNFGNTILFNIVIKEHVKSFHNLVNILYSWNEFKKCGGIPLMGLM